MLTKYLEAAMRHAHYQILADSKQYRNSNYKMTKTSQRSYISPAASCLLKNRGKFNCLRQREKTV